MLSMTEREVALAWHDETCPESYECRSRDLHAASNGAMLVPILATLRRLGVPVLRATPHVVE